MSGTAERGGPLGGVRVLELAGLGPGPFAAMLLADLGADVVRVDRPERGGMFGMDPALDFTNRGKRSVELDLKTEEGAAAVLALAERADLLVEGFRPGVAERLGVGPEQALAANPRLVYGRVTGWGQEGPLAHRAGHDLTYLAPTGALALGGDPEAPPTFPANLLGDFAGGSLYLVVGLLAALRHAERTGEGQVVDAAIVDGAAHLTTLLHGLMAAGGWQDRRGSNLLDGGSPFYGCYETADGRHMAVGALEKRFYNEFTERLGIAGTAPAREDFDHWDELRARIAAAFRTRTRAEWTKVFADSDGCVAPVLSLREAPHHPHLAVRNTFVPGPDGTPQPAPAPRFSATPAPAPGPLLTPGADTVAVAEEWGVEGLTDQRNSPSGA
ncbi:CaiB/BaiF CoA-transferase family protein [Streptomyces sp. NEAU-H3]|uniref:CaiB/BaiF CoA transferase family protein n=1 Tax=unclassified Streptomyces TaxID=2593676 RepID=UPI001438A8C5|nr:CaiB/BaiF CoA-transferase family protein [Streptomyces sp. NEAU-H3]NJA57456.1 CoA transferase [Streptomyces sp. NEAU-H3]